MEKTNVMVDSLPIVEPKVFKALLAADAIQQAVIRVAGDQGLVAILTVGQQQQVLGQYRGGPRYFQSMDAAASLLAQNGITNFEVDIDGWAPRTRPKAKDGERKSKG